jgi:predicted small lipoprotein YifL
LINPTTITGNCCNFYKRKLQMKKSLVLAAMFAIALAACGKKEEAKPAEAAPAAAPAAPAADAKK